ncbi:MAG: phosphatase PAP2 family protein [Holosporales bacterium]|jgi:lipid A 4'-phosphatase
MYKNVIVASLAGMLAVGGFFNIFPQYDSGFSRLFFDATQGVFPAKTWSFFRLLNEAVDGVAVVVAGIALAVFYKKNLWGISRRQALYLLLVLILGPGIVVNTVFKDNWGRARPIQTIEFGGSKHFTPVGIISDQCPRNCSFPSGDASVGYYFVALAGIRQRRRLWAILGVGTGLGLGLVRVMQGAHYISDAIFSGLMVVLVAAVVWRLLFEHDKKPSSSFNKIS